MCGSSSQRLSSYLRLSLIWDQSQSKNQLRMSHFIATLVISTEISQSLVMAYQMTGEPIKFILDENVEIEPFDSESQSENFTNQSENAKDNSSESSFKNRSNSNCHHLSNQKSYVKSHGIPLACGLGLFGNCVVTVFLILSDYKQSKFKQSLIALSISDILFLSVLLIEEHSSFAKECFGRLYPYFWHPSRSILITFETYMIMSISLERFIALYRPLHYKTSIVNTSKKVHCFTFVVLPMIVSFLLNIPKYFEIEMVQQNSTSSSSQEKWKVELTNLRLNENYLYYYIYLTRLICTGVFPMLFLLVMNFLIFTVMCRKKMNSQKNFLRRQSTAAVEIKRSFLDAIPLFSIVVFFIGCNISIKAMT